jgi:hypothetical protein
MASHVQRYGFDRAQLANQLRKVCWEENYEGKEKQITSISGMSLDAAASLQGRLRGTKGKGRSKNEKTQGADCELRHHYHADHTYLRAGRCEHMACKHHHRCLQVMRPRKGQKGESYRRVLEPYSEKNLLLSPTSEEFLLCLAYANIKIVLPGAQSHFFMFTL